MAVQIPQVGHYLWGEVEQANSSSSPAGDSRRLEDVEVLPDSSSASFQAGGSSDASYLSELCEIFDKVDSEEAWTNLSAKDQADVFTLLAQAAEDGTMPLGLQEFWSKGSETHARGKCRPCHYVHTDQGCKHGRECSFCHVIHTTKSHRPSQTQRRYCKRFVTALSGLSSVQAEESKLLLQQMVKRSAYLQALLRGHDLDLQQGQGGRASKGVPVQDRRLGRKQAGGRLHRPADLTGAGVSAGAAAPGRGSEAKRDRAKAVCALVLPTLVQGPCDGGPAPQLPSGKIIVSL